MRFVTLTLLALLALLQYPLWLGKGSWLRVWDVDRQITEQRGVNAQLKARNAALDAEVRDLKQGVGAVEERARNELGMIRHDEIFFQMLDASAPTSLDPSKTVVAHGAAPPDARRSSANAVARR